MCMSHNYIYSREQIVIAYNFLLVKQLRLQRPLEPTYKENFYGTKIENYDDDEPT